ncbi:hypothetical protein BDZ89DRAFT_1149667 [Hymenopellis radicata]|nr:hypothetical protein BDZ89DRAFT_1149667 [Hymenopellis radicata]
MGRPWLYSTPEEKKAATKRNQKVYYQRNAEHLRRHQRYAYAAKKREEDKKRDHQCDPPRSRMPVAEQEICIHDDFQHLFYTFFEIIGHDARAYAYKAAVDALSLPAPDRLKYVQDMLEHLDTFLDLMFELQMQLRTLSGEDTTVYGDVSHTLRVVGYKLRAYVYDVLEHLEEGTLALAVANSSLRCTTFT